MREAVAPRRLLSDERLARRAAGGDKSAFAEIFRRYHSDLYRFCLATVGNQHDAQEALQNTMVKVLRALPGEKREIKLKPWLYRIARNEAVETVRRRRDSVDLSAEETADTAQITEIAAARERLRHLFSDLRSLPERQRAALVMRELSGLDFAAIGDAFGTTPEVARQTLYEARQSLQQIEQGREMSCKVVQRALSDADGRVTRRRDVRAHLHACADCRAFRDGIAERRANLAAIAPLPLAVSSGMLQSLLGGQASGAAAAGVGVSGGAGGGTVAGSIGAGTAKLAAGSALVKSAATVAVVTAVGVTAAERSGVIDLPLDRDGGPPASDVEGGTTGDRHGHPVSPTGASDAPAVGGGAAAGTPRRENESGAQADVAAKSGQAKGAKVQSGKAGNPPPSSPAEQSGNTNGQANRKSAESGNGPPQEPPAASERGEQPAESRKPSTAPPAPPSGASPPAAARGKSRGKAGGRAPSPPAAPTESAPAGPPNAEPPPVPSAPQGKGGGPNG